MSFKPAALWLSSTPPSGRIAELGSMRHYGGLTMKQTLANEWGQANEERKSLFVLSPFACHRSSAE